jgi:hypothetical protein
MDITPFINQMSNQAKTIASLTQGVSDEQARWKPAAESWSMLEVINHLYDEEREDFRVRLDYILHRGDEPWPPIDPRGWVVAREYQKRDFRESLNNFLAEREKSLAWLQSLGAPNLEISTKAPWGGEIKAGDMLAAWVAHDLLHTRQFVELHWAYTNLKVQPYQVSYAGDW